MFEVIGTGPAPGEMLVIAGLGQSANWFRNIQARSGAESRSDDVAHAVPRKLAEPEVVAALADYEHRNRFVRPVVRRALTWLVGWTYDGTDDSRRRLVRQLPVIALRPG